MNDLESGYRTLRSRIGSYRNVVVPLLNAASSEPDAVERERLYDSAASRVDGLRSEIGAAYQKLGDNRPDMNGLAVSLENLSQSLKSKSDGDPSMRGRYDGRIVECRSAVEGKAENAIGTLDSLIEREARK